MDAPHFTDDTFAFLAALGMNNERTWFEAHKARYEGSVREPARAFIRAMAPLLAPLSPHLVADDRKAGGSLMRVFRDTRFSKDKTPYKTNIGIQFRLGHDKDVHAPGLYVHISPDELFLGAGMWHPPAEALAAFRDRLVAEPDAWSAVIAPVSLGPGIALWDGEPLKRTPRGYPADHVHAEHLKRTSFLLSADLSAPEVLSTDFAELTAARFARMMPFMRFLCGALGLAI